MKLLIYKIMKAGLIVGTLDIVSACIRFYIKTGGQNVLNLLKFVASGMFGKAALSGGNSMVVAGLIFHYFIAFSFTVFFFWLYPKIKGFSKSRIITGVIYGGFVWTVMNLIVVPMSGIGARPFNLANSIINAVILIVCIGVPLSFMAARFYKKDSITSSAPVIADELYTG